MSMHRSTSDDEYDQAKELAAIAAPHLNKGGGELKAIGIDIDATVFSALDNAKGAGQRMQSEMAGARGNLEHHPDGRAANERKAWETGTAAIDEHAATTQTAVTVARKALTAKCAPQEPTDAAEKASLRDEVRQQLDAHASDPEHAVLAILLGDDRELAAVVYGSYGRRFLKANGVTLDEQTVAALDKAMIEGARQHGTDEQKRAAAALSTGGAIESLVKGIGAHLSGVKSYVGK